MDILKCQFKYGKEIRYPNIWGRYIMWIIMLVRLYVKELWVGSLHYENMPIQIILKFTT